MCARLADILGRNPFFKGVGTSIERSKVIALASWEDAKICDIFNHNAHQKLGDNRAWHIHHFGKGTSNVFDHLGNRIEKGLTLSFVSGDDRRCSIKALKETYQEVLDELTTGWKPSNIEDHPEILFKEKPEEFALFVKPKGILQESELVNAIATRLSLGKDLRCSDIWIEPPAGVTQGKTYLWIRKSAQADVIAKLGLQLSSKL